VPRLRHRDPRAPARRASPVTACAAARPPPWPRPGSHAGVLPSSHSGWTRSTYMTGVGRAPACPGHPPLARRAWSWRARAGPLRAGVPRCGSIAVDVVLQHLRPLDQRGAGRGPGVTRPPAVTRRAGPRYASAVDASDQLLGEGGFAEAGSVLGSPLSSPGCRARRESDHLLLRQLWIDDGAAGAASLDGSSTYSWMRLHTTSGAAVVLEEAVAGVQARARSSTAPRPAVPHSGPGLVVTQCLPTSPAARRCSGPASRSATRGAGAGPTAARTGAGRRPAPCPRRRRALPFFRAASAPRSESSAWFLPPGPLPQESTCALGWSWISYRVPRLNRPACPTRPCAEGGLHVVRGVLAKLSSVSAVRLHDVRARPTSTPRAALSCRSVASMDGGPAPRGGPGGPSSLWARPCAPSTSARDR